MQGGMHKIECFKIQLLQAGQKEAIRNFETEPVFQILCDKWAVLKEPTIIVADPFLFVHNDRLYLFYEQKKLYRNGTIMMTHTEDLRHWSEPIQVLQESFHLSYPWVFEKDGYIYMIPETCGDGSVRLDEAANSTLTEFWFVKKILEQEPDDDIKISYSDSSIVERAGLYYLFTTVNYKGVNQLLLFCSDNLMGPYQRHPQSPVCVSQKYGRNAGSFLEYKGELYRVAQDCEKRYGNNVHILKVNELSPTEYTEEVIKENIFNNRKPFYREGGHQLNIAKYKGSYVFATDAKEYHYFVLNRVLHKIGI